MGKRELVAFLNLSSWCLVMVGWLFLAVPWGCLRFVIVAFPDHTHLLFFIAHARFEVTGETARLCRLARYSVVRLCLLCVDSFRKLKFPDFIFSVNKESVALEIIETHLN